MCLQIQWNLYSFGAFPYSYNCGEVLCRSIAKFSRKVNILSHKGNCTRFVQQFVNCFDGVLLVM